MDGFPYEVPEEYRNMPLLKGRATVEMKVKVKVVHAYGHGGGGYQSSWGTAEEVVRLVEGMAGTKAKL